ncbi:MAG: NAD(P)-dependent glycerol-3-phosphate dehydrogenase [Deltaproteobacteria bacterium]|nr:NAD(P)-dependent glycerol-3-phosphate dehydrogenase [Deltaproteobacteria bacterium]
MMEKIAVLGAGSWGTTLSQVLSDSGAPVTLWAREEEVRESIAKRRVNETFLPGIVLSEKITPEAGIRAAVEGADFIVSVIPSHGVRAVFSEAGPFIRKDAIIVSATKGIEEGSMLTPSGILNEALKGCGHKAIAVLSGPSFANEVSRRLPAAVCAASTSIEAARAVQQAFSTNYFRVYANTDVIGVELGGALKNVIAIAAGISDGLALGHNARAALITRGLAEMGRLGAALGALPATFAGLSGLGDLVLTCTGPLSRNYTVGVSVGKGASIDEVTGSMRMVAEGVKTCRGASDLARRHNVDMPITEAVFSVLYKGVSPMKAVMGLMGRELKDE